METVVIASLHHSPTLITVDVSHPNLHQRRTFASVMTIDPQHKP
jgi:hypothetical protein